MTILTFLGTMDVTDDDTYGTIMLKLVFDLHCAIRSRSDEELIEAKARNIIKVCCEPMFDDLIQEYEWSLEETEYADQVLEVCIEEATFELLEIANCRMTHQRKRERRTGLCIDDLKISAVMAYVMHAPELVTCRLEETFEEDHGAMYFRN